VRIGDVMTRGVVTADSAERLHAVGELMRHCSVEFYFHQRGG
jgi:hypothetical protein